MIISAIRFAVQRHFIYPIVGRILDYGFRRLRGQDGWDGVITATAHALIESSTSVVVRARVAEVLMDVGPYLSQDSVEVLRLIDEIAQKHSPEAN